MSTQASEKFTPAQKTCMSSLLQQPIHNSTSQAIPIGSKVEGKIMDIAMVPVQESALESFFLDSLAFWLDTTYVIKFSSGRTDFIFAANSHGLGLHFSGYDKKPNPTCQTKLILQRTLFIYLWR